MQSDVTLSTLAAIPALGVACQWTAWRVRLPSILFLLLAGFLVGPVAGLIDPDRVIGPVLPTLVTMAVALVLYEGGLSLRWSEVREIRHVVNRLLLVGVPVTWLLASALGWGVLGLDPGLALLVGAVLTVSGPTVVGPLLEAVRPRRRVAAVLKWESILIDPVGATLAVLVYGCLVAHHSVEATEQAVLRFLQTLLVGGVLGALGAATLLKLLRRFWLPDSLHNGLSMALVLSVFSLCEQVRPESGLFAVTLMGMLLANQEEVEVRHLVDFSETIRLLVVGSLFIVLSARQSMESLAGQVDVSTLLFVAGLVLVVRPLAVALSAAGSTLTAQERLFVSFLAPRGIVAAATASVFALRLQEVGVPGAQRVVSLVFLVVVALGVVYGLACLPLAAALGLRRAPPQGCLFLGAHLPTRRIARGLQDAGVKAVVADLDLEQTEQARAEGLHAVTPAGRNRAISEDDLQELGQVLALGPSPDFNALLVTHFAEAFPRSRRYQLPEEDPVPRPGRPLFHPQATYEELLRRLEEGAEVRRVPFGKAGAWEALLQEHPDRVLPLFVLGPDGQVHVVVAGQAPSPRPGHDLLALVGPSHEARPA